MAVEKLKTKISIAKKKWDLLNSILENDEYSNLEYVALERCVEILAQTIIDVCIWITRYIDLEVPKIDRSGRQLSSDFPIFIDTILEYIETNPK